LNRGLYDQPAPVLEGSNAPMKIETGLSVRDEKLARIDWDARTGFAAGLSHAH